jgi:TP901 family phage tail tape measure protein
MATSVGNLWVDVRFDTSAMAGDLRRSLSGIGAGAGADAGSAVAASMSQRLQTLGTSLGNVGRQVSLGLSLPLIAMGKAATDAFVRFDTAMTQVTTLSGVASSTVRGWTDDVMGLGPAYGVAADEAAEALYFITSSGVDAADAMEVLDIAAKSSALGLGTAKTAADVMTSALNQYGEENISAAEAADILTVAVREGKGEADAMAGALATVIPLAGSMGVSFGEVSGVLSAMTLSGTSADQAATQINALLTTMQKMPKHAQEDMKALTGLDYATVQQSIRTRGLTETLKTLYNAFGDNEDAIGRVFGNVRALRGITNLFGEKEEQTLAVVAQTTDAIGAQDRAMAKLAESPAFQLKTAQANFKNAMTAIGSGVTPVFATLTGGFAAVLSAVQYLPAPIQTLAVSLGALGAAAGPLLYVGSSVLRLAGNIGTAMTALSNLGAVQGTATAIMYLNSAINTAAAGGAKWAKVISLMTGNLGLMVAGVGTAIVAYQTLNSVIHATDEELRRLGEQGAEKSRQTDTFAELAQRVRIANEMIAKYRAEVERLDKEQEHSYIGAFNLGLAKTRQEAIAAAEAMQAMGVAALQAQVQAVALSERHKITRDAAAKWLAAQATAGKVFKNSEDALAAYTDGLKNNDAATQQAVIDTEKHKNSLSGVIAAAKETSDAFFGVINAQKAYTSAQKAIEDAKGKVIDAEQAHADAIKGVADAQRKVVEADRKVIESGQKVADARQAAADAQKRLNDLLAGPSKSEQLDVRSARLAVREAEEGVRGKNLTPLERERAQIALERARLDLAEAERAHEENIADARRDVTSATDAVAEAERARQDAITAAAQSRTDLQVARDKEHTTLLNITKAQQDVAQAELDAIGPAMALTAEQDKLNTKFATGNIEAKAFRDYLTNLKTLYPELSGALQGYIDKFNEFQQTATPPGKTASDVLGGSISATERNALPPPPAPKTPQFPAPPPGGYHILGAAPAPVATAPKPFGPQLNVAAINVYGADQPVQTAYEVRRQLRAKRDLVGRR